MRIEIIEKETSGGTFLDITIDGITVYGCSRRKGISRGGKDYDFISTPQRKGKDREGNDKYWAIVKFSDETNDAILRKLDEGTIPDTNNNDVPF